jgi:hypothetical protein
MKSIRNAFSHNQFPEVYLFKDQKHQKNANFAEMFLEKIENTYGKITAAF